MATEETRSRTRRTATQARASRRARRRARRRFLRYGAATAVGAVAAAFIIALFLPGLPVTLGGGLFGRGAPDGPGERMVDQGRAHIAAEQGHAAYNSRPGTSGWHYPIPLAPARWGVHTEVLADEVLLHNLEHGGVGVHYDCPEGCDELVEQLSAIVNRAVGEGLKVIMSPYPDIMGGERIALTAWIFLDKFNEFDEERVKAFIKAHESSPNSPEANAR